MVDAPDVVSRALREAPPDQLAEAADRAIRSAMGALRTDVFVADYRISGLWPRAGPGPAGGAASWPATPWRSAASAASSRCATARARAGSTCR